MKRIPTDRERKSQERIIELINTECGDGHSQITHFRQKSAFFRN